MTRVALAATTPWGSNRRDSSWTSLPVGPAPQPLVSRPTPGIGNADAPAAAGDEARPPLFEGPVGISHAIQEKWAAAAMAVAAVRTIGEDPGPPGLCGADTATAGAGNTHRRDSCGPVAGPKAATIAHHLGTTGFRHAKTVEGGSCGSSRRASVAFCATGGSSSTSHLVPAGKVEMVSKVLGWGAEDVVMADEDYA